MVVLEAFPSQESLQKFSTHTDEEEHLKPGSFAGTFYVSGITKCGEDK